MKDVWKERAWKAASAMKLAEKCRTVDEMRRVLAQARLEIEAWVVQDQNERDMLALERLTAEGVDE